MVGNGPPSLADRAAPKRLEAGGDDGSAPLLALDNWDRAEGADTVSPAGNLPPFAGITEPLALEDSPPASQPSASALEEQGPGRPWHASLAWRLSQVGPRGRVVLVAALLILVVAETLYIARRVTTAAPAPPSVGSIRVSSDPAGADVRVDGAAAGRAPMALQLPGGRHVVELASGGQRRTITVDVKPGETSSLVVGLSSATAATGQLRVTTTPAGARVFVDGQPRGTSPILVGDLEPGEHDVRVEGRARSVRQSVVVEAGTTAALLLPLPGGDAPAPGWLSVASPEELQIYSEGELLGTSRSARIMVPAGRYELDLVNEELGVRTTQEASVSAGRTATVEVALPTSRVDLNATPWAEVWVDGARVGETPLAGVPVTVGRHTVTFRHPELGERRVECVVTLKRRTRLGVDLRK
jgi:hypothetical protein